MSWTRLYRPKQMAGLHQQKVKQQLSEFLQKGKIPQVLLFAGPKGTGKTSAARIIAAIVNDPQNEPQVARAYFKQSKESAYQPLNDASLTKQTEQIIQGRSFMVNEMDAASNRGIDEMRQLQERAALPPQIGQMSVYILDEAHMLTTPAFNALLKLLEEPPPHTIFVLATTEPEKIPETIISRSQVVRFEKATADEIAEALGQIVKDKKIKVDQFTLQRIIDQSQGSFRDAVKTLESITHQSKVDPQVVLSLLGANIDNEVWQLVDAILDKNNQQIIELIRQFRKNSISSQLLHNTLLKLLHHDLILAIEGQSEARLSARVSRFLLTEFSSLQPAEAGPIPLLPIELKALELVFRSTQKNGSGEKPTRQRQTKPTSNSKRNSSLEATTAQKTEIIQAHTGDAQKLLANWPDFVSGVAQINSAIAALLQSAKPVGADNDLITIHVYYKFHQEQLSHPKTQALLAQAMLPIAGGSVGIDCQLSSTPAQADLVEPEVVNTLTQIAAKTLM